MDILDFISSDNYIPYNRTLAKKIGLENAILFGALCGYQRHYKQQEFFREQEKIMEDTCLTEYAVRKAVKELKELNLISVIKKGLPAKYYYKINTTSVLELLSTSGNENDTTSEIEKPSTNNKNNNKNENNNIYSEVLDYLNLKAETRYRKVESNFKYIKARLNDGFTIDDFKVIIDKKCQEWKGTEFERYLTPETLFRPSNFEKYLNQKIIKKKDNSNFQQREYTKEEMNVYDNIDDMEI